MHGFGIDGHEEGDALVEVTIREFSNIDPNSFSYRYPVDTKGGAIPLGQDQLNLPNLADVMTSLENYFTGCDVYLDHLKSATP